MAAAIDPFARQILDAVEPWDAYHAANGIPGSLVDALESLPHGGSLYRAWAELTDLFESGTTPVSDAHAVLRQAATDWLAGPGDPTDASIEVWLERTQASVNVLFDRDGTFWDPK